MTNLEYWYEIDPVEVAASVENAVKDLERHRVRANGIKVQRESYWPDSDNYYNLAIRREREHYSTVRIINLPSEFDPRRPYCLMYGEDLINVTGGFKTIQEAALFFVRGGR